MSPGSVSVSGPGAHPWAHLAVFVLLAQAAQAAAAAAAAAAVPSGGEAETVQSFTEPIDLTHPINRDSQNWPGTKKFEYTIWGVTAAADGGFFAIKEFCLSGEVGTHLDAPYHYNQTGWKVGDIPLGRLLVPGVLIDASEAAAANRNLSLGREALDAWERAHGAVPAGSVVLLRFGWAAKYHSRGEYFGTDGRGGGPYFPVGLSFPGVSVELARALVERKIFGVGLDTPSIDPGFNGEDKPEAHRAFCDANIYIIENVNLGPKALALPPKGFTLIVLPANIQEGTGAPVRIVAVPGTNRF